MPVSRRLFAITACVTLLHAGAVWMGLAGLGARPPQVWVPVMLLADLDPAAKGATVTAATAPPPRPALLPAPAPPAPATSSTPTSAAAVTHPPGATPAPAPAPSPSPSPSPATSPAAGRAETSATSATSGTSATSATSATSGTSGTSATSAAATATAPGAAPARVELPSSDAAYLQNPKPAYPPQSRRLGEQGQVVVRVLIGADGAPQSAQVQRSSGYYRLDQAALTAVLKWRYVPGKRGGTPEAMWFNIPINFVLE